MQKFTKLTTGLIFFVILTSIFSCKKDTDITPAPVPPNVIDTMPIGHSDTVTLIRKLEETYFSTTRIRKTKSIYFYYDAEKRVSAVGIKNYDILFDTASTRFFYIGHETKPFQIISPNSQMSSWGVGTVQYDTSYFFYSGQGALIKDSARILSYLPGGGTWRPLLIRRYNYINSHEFTVQMLMEQSADNSMRVFRSDTVRFQADTTFEQITASFPYAAIPGHIDAVVEGVRKTNIINPLAKLNISGLHYSWITTPNEVEILGNFNYKAVGNSNILATYMDFASQYLPSAFFNTAYNTNHMFLNSDEFNIDVTPWNERIKYPKSIRVTGSSGYPGDAFIYDYYY